MLVLRLMRRGAKKKPFYDLVAVDSRKPLRSWPAEKLGFYNPMLPNGHEDRFKFNEERVKYRIGVGAQASDRVKYLLNKAGYPIQYNMKKPKSPKNK